MLVPARWRLAPDPPTGGGGGGDAQSGTPATGTQAQGTPGAAAGPAPGASAPVTQADLRTFADGMFANMRRMVEGIQGRGGEGQSGSNGSNGRSTATPPAVDVQQMIARERALTDALTAHRGLTRPQVDLIRRNFDRDTPATESIQSYVADITAAFSPQASAPGNGTGTQTTTASATVPTNPPNGRPVSDGGAPGQSDAIANGAPVWRMSEDAVNQLIREKGFYQAGVELRTRLNRDLRDRRIYIGRERR